MTTLKKLTPDELKNIQGIIISGYGHLPYLEYQFVSCGEGGQARTWLSEIVPEVTSSYRPQDESGKKKRPGCALNLAFTHEGIQKFGIHFASEFSQEFQ